MCRKIINNIKKNPISIYIRVAVIHFLILLIKDIYKATHTDDLEEILFIYHSSIWIDLGRGILWPLSCIYIGAEIIEYLISL